MTEELKVSPYLASEADRLGIGKVSDQIGHLRDALEWIATIADKEYERDHKLRADGARTLKRISDRARVALSLNQEPTQ